MSYSDVPLKYKAYIANFIAAYSECADGSYSKIFTANGGRDMTVYCKGPLGRMDYRNAQWYQKQAEALKLQGLVVSLPQPDLSVSNSESEINARYAINSKFYSFYATCGGKSGPLSFGGFGGASNAGVIGTNEKGQVIIDKCHSLSPDNSARLDYVWSNF